MLWCVLDFVLWNKPDSSFVLCSFSQQQLLHDSDSISGVGGESESGVRGMGAGVVCS